MADITRKKLSRHALKILILLLSLIPSQVAVSQGPDSDRTPELYFNILPSKQFFSMGESVVIGLELYSRSEQPILVSRLQNNEFLRFKLLGPDGNEVPWRSEARANKRDYSPSDFFVLEQYKSISADRDISLNDGEGFAFYHPGQYTLIAEFSMGAPENFAAFAGRANSARGTFRSTKLAFCIEACILEPLPVRNNAPRPALETVRLFYTYITKHPQLGMPSRRAKKALWPLMSNELAKKLESLGECDDDYSRRFGEIDRANTYKPSIPWLEEGLFTGPDDAATPSAFRILESRAVGESRVDVLISFQRDWGEPQGYVTVIRENDRWVVDDYVAMYMNDELLRLSAGYSRCNGGKWIGEEHN